IREDLPALARECCKTIGPSGNHGCSMDFVGTLRWRHLVEYDDCSTPGTRCSGLSAIRYCGNVSWEAGIPSASGAGRPLCRSYHDQCGCFRKSKYSLERVDCDVSA